MWQIEPSGEARVILLGKEIGIQNAADFHGAVLPLALAGGAVRVDAGGAVALHPSVLQILYALSMEVKDFQIINKSNEFRAIEARVGLQFPDHSPT